ncbi:MAG TPA: endo alpha-1,4 polygalactosaminidase [Paenibacillus sp.]|nr:endo alpha-1,4 polygalactosaminidase [Paenibacillus sp.]
MTTRRERFREMKRYALYYGYGETERLASFDAAIVEPKGHTKDSIATLRAEGTLAIAYVSVIEIASFDPLYPMLESSDFLTIGGSRARNEGFDTELVSLRSERWRGLLSHRIGSLLFRDGYDGVFLDTIGDAEWTSLGGESPKECEAAAAFVTELRKLFPDHILIQNNGLEYILERTAAVVDAYCWENPPVGVPGSVRWIASLSEHLRRFRERHGTLALCVTDREDTAEATKRWAESEGYRFYAASSNYLRM